MFLFFLFVRLLPMISILESEAAAYAKVKQRRRPPMIRRFQALRSAGRIR